MSRYRSEADIERCKEKAGSATAEVSPHSFTRRESASHHGHENAKHGLYALNLLGSIVVHFAHLNCWSSHCGCYLTAYSGGHLSAYLNAKLGSPSLHLVKSLFFLCYLRMKQLPFNQHFKCWAQPPPTAHAQSCREFSTVDNWSQFRHVEQVFFLNVGEEFVILVNHCQLLATTWKKHRRLLYHWRIRHRP